MTLVRLRLPLGDRALSDVFGDVSELPSRLHNLAEIPAFVAQYIGTYYVRRVEYDVIEREEYWQWDRLLYYLHASKKTRDNEL